MTCRINYNSSLYLYFIKKTKQNLSFPDHINEDMGGQLMNQNIYKKFWNAIIIWLEIFGNFLIIEISIV